MQLVSLTVHLVRLMNAMTSTIRAGSKGGHKRCYMYKWIQGAGSGLQLLISIFLSYYPKVDRCACDVRMRSQH